MMSTAPKKPVLVVAVVERAATRIGQRAALRTAAVAIGVAAALLLVARAVGANSQQAIAIDLLLLVVIAALGAAVGWWQSHHARSHAAELLDARVPDSKNLLVTANELLPRTTTPNGNDVADVPALVLARADAVARRVNVSGLFPRLP